MTTPTRSLIVVINGPDATAGSMFILLKKRGTIVPINPETNMAAISAMPAQPDMAKASIKV